MPTAEIAIDLKEHPIMLTLQSSGNELLARITMSGRALMRLEDGKWWMFGVRPAGMAASGENIDEAFLNFRSRYKDILFDIAQESKTFEEFDQAVRRFFDEGDSDNEDEQLWEAALQTIRNGCLQPPAPFAKLPRRSPETAPSFINIDRMDAQAKDKRLMPSENVSEVFAYSSPKAA